MFVLLKAYGTVHECSMKYEL